MDFDAASIIAEAEAATGVTDTETAVRANLDRLIASLKHEFPTTPEGQAWIRRSFVGDTIHRLEALKWVSDFPEIAEEPVTAPVFLMGLPRSGTTFFQYLFDRDERFRLIRTWQSTAPSPPPGFDPESVGRRKAQWLERRKAEPMFEGFDAMHLIDADGSDECHALLAQSFGGVGLNNLYRVPSYFDYLLDEADLAETYRVHKRQLQLLQWKLERKPWALKYPNHVIAIDAILKVYPDARFVQTHRDPVQTLASIAKLTANLRAMRSAAPIDPLEVGKDMLYFIQRHIDRILETDRSAHGDRIFHVDFYALSADPVGQMRLIHEAIGIDTPAPVADAVAAWHAANPKNSRGVNDYALEQYGLDQAAVADQFGDYIRRFEIPREAVGIARMGANA
ncbi:MAG: sulfotransferase [Novosphingobium sp.]